MSGSTEPQFPGDFPHQIVGCGFSIAPEKQQDLFDDDFLRNVHDIGVPNGIGTLSVASDSQNRAFFIFGRCVFGNCGFFCIPIVLKLFQPLVVEAEYLIDLTLRIVNPVGGPNSTNLPAKTFQYFLPQSVTIARCRSAVIGCPVAFNP